jgi:hypothetical protein
MSASKNTLRLLGAAALAGLVFHTAPATAQRPCGDTLVATTFYSKVIQTQNPAGSGAPSSTLVGETIRFVCTYSAG